MSAKKKKPLQDGELPNGASLTGFDSLFKEFSNKYEIMFAIQDIKLSYRLTWKSATCSHFSLMNQ